MRIYRNKNQELQAKISALETKQKNELLALKMEVNTAYNQFTPSSLLNRAITDIKETPKAKNNLFEILVSIAGGFLSKKLLVGKSNNLFRSLLGYAVQYVSTKIIQNKI